MRPLGHAVAGLVLVLLAAAPLLAAISGVPTSLNAAGQVCAAIGTPAGCTAVSADPPGWLVLERTNSGSANGDVVKQIRFFVHVTGPTLDIRVFDPGLSGARDLGNAFTMRYRLLTPAGATLGELTIGADTATTQNALVRFACQDGGGTTALFTALDAAAGAANRIWGAGTGGGCTARPAGLYVFEATAQGTSSVEGRNAFGVEFLDASGSPYNAFTIGAADNTINAASATDTSMISGAVAGDRPTANVSGYTAFFPQVDRGCSIEAINFDLDADNAEGNGSVATVVDTLGASTSLARSNNDNVATTNVTVEPATTANPDSNNYGMYTLTTQLDEWATAQNHVDWRIADFQGSTAGSPANLPRSPTSPVRMYLPNGYSACSISGCTVEAPREPVLAASAVLLAGENPPLPGGATTRFALTATVGNPGTSAIASVQITLPLAAGTTFVSETGTVDGVAAACTSAPGAGYRRCTFPTLAAGSYASLVVEVDYQPPATGLQNLTGPPAAGAPPPNTTVWAQYVPASQSASFPRTETLGPVCQLSVVAATSIDWRVRAPAGGVTDAPDPVTAGQNLTYSYRVDTASGTATNPSFANVLPAGTTFVSVGLTGTGSGSWSCVTPPVGTGGTVRCSAPSHGTADIAVTVVVAVASTVPNGTVLTGTVSAQSANADPNTSNNSLSITTSVVSPAASADVGITKTDTPDPVAAGQDVAYTIAVSNAGPATAIDVTLSDTIPAGATFQSISTALGWSCTTPPVGGTGALGCVRPSLARGETSALVLRVRVNPGTPPGTVIGNTAGVTSAVADPSPGNDTATTTTTVAAANTCPTPGRDGPGGTLAGTVNTYYPGIGTAAAGSVSLTLGTSRGAATPIAVGDLVLVVQVQDAAIDTANTDAYGDGTAGDGEARGATAPNSTGRYEYAVAASAVPVGGGTLSVTQGLLNTYTSAAATTTTGQRRFQVIRVPQYTTATLGPTLTAAYWDGASGGVLAFDVQGALGLGSASVSVSGRGFRGGGARQLTGAAGGSGTAYVSAAPGGGAAGFHASKGEGTAGTPRYVYDPGTLAVVDRGAANEGYPSASGSFARGAPGTAGGGGTDSNPAANDQNSGGGGGGNGGLGGRGGNAWNSNAPVGGFGGAGIAASAALMTLGGGGGAGSRNNSAGDQSSGNAGGGVVMIRADSLAGTGTIEADGLSADTPDTTPANDGGGGGGAGGSVLVYAPSGGFGGLTVNARGGAGSDAWPTVAATSYPGERHGPGGGGGGGRVFLSGAPLATGVAGGISGTTSVVPEVYGASDGSPGTVSLLEAADIPGVDTTGPCSPLAASVVDLGITVAGPPDPLEPCASADYGFSVVSNGPDDAIDAVVSFPVPPSTTFLALASPPGWTCTTPAAGGSGTASCTTASFARGATAGFTLTLRIGCGVAPGSVLAVGGSVSTSSTDTYSPNDTAGTTSLVGAPLFVLTRASLRGLRVRPAEGLVEFATGWQHATRGFHLYETDDPAGRLGLRRLTDALVEAPRPDSQTPLVYSVRTGPITARYLLIEELERGGRRHRLGPFPTGDPRLERLMQRVEARVDRVGAIDTALDGRVRVRGLRASSRRSREPSPAHRVRRRPPLVPAALKIETGGTGVASVGRLELLAAGLPPAMPLARCRLTNAGRGVAFTVRDRGGPAEAIVFLAEALETPYTSRNAYVLSWSGAVPRMGVPITREGDLPRPGYERVGPPVLYVASVPPGTDPWLWDQLVPGFGAWPYHWDPEAGRFDLPGWPAAGGPVPVRLRFQGMTPHRHVLTAWLNGERLGEIAFDGATTGYMDAVATTLRPAGNDLRVEYAAEEEDPDAYAYLDYVEAMRPGGFTSPPVAATASAFDATLPALAADYLVVTHPDFEAQAERLAAAKRRQGLRVAVVDVASVYDRLSGGIPEARAVAEVVRRARAAGPLRFVLLLGDDSFDPDDRALLGGRSFVPSLTGWDGVFGRVASENRYADTDGDGRPDVAIGRLPARTPAEAEALVRKVEEQEARFAAAAGRQLFAADDPGPDRFDFAGEARAAATRLSGPGPATFVDLREGIAGARERLFAALAEGAAFTHYFGHAGPQAWADEGLLTLEDAASLPGAGTVVLSWTCLAQFYQYLFGPSVNEALVLRPSGGALAAFGPAGITDAPLQAALYERLYDELARGSTTLGEAIRSAKARAVAEDPRTGPVVEGFNLLGDPALVIGPGTVRPPND